MERKREVLLTLCALAAIAPGVAAYKETTHGDITKYATLASELNSPTTEILTGLGLGNSVEKPSFLTADPFGVPMPISVRDLLVRGAREEDEGLNSVRHFFDPQRDGTGILAFEPSPKWALDSDAGGQVFSLSDARQYLLSALMGPSEIQRTSDLSKVFLSLGHVVHHVQDMHQPQHVRSDLHCDDTPLKLLFFLPFPQGCATELVSNAIHRPSAYEQYVWQQGIVPVSGYPTPDYATFDSARAFWENGGKGGAEFTSNNFVSVRTNFKLDASTTPFTIQSHASHPLPRGADALLVTKDINDPELIHKVTSPQPMAGDISLVRTPVTDLYAPGFSVPNDRASTLSIWYEPLLQGVPAPVVPAAGFTLNSINYHAAMERLVPRAAAYSTGLINYFFRGRIGIELPEQGVYGIVDHATTYAAGQGFDKLKLKLRNTSPDGVKPSGEHVPQAMQGGTLVAVAKYTLNSCYQPDLTGDYALRLDTNEVVPPASCSVEQYLAGDEQISQSAAQLAVTLDKTPAEFTFDFSSQPIPVNARDLRIQVVYTGPLGAEADGIAFGGRDISEPTQLMVYNNSDYYAVDGKLYTPAQIQSDPALKQRVGSQNLDPKPLASVVLAAVPGKPLTGVAVGVPVNGYVRVAVLGEVDTPLSLTVDTRFEGSATTRGTFGGIWTNLTDLRIEPAFVSPLVIYRGPRAHFVDVVFRGNNATPLASGELVKVSAHAMPDPGPTQIPLNF